MYCFDYGYLIAPIGVVIYYNVFNQIFLYSKIDNNEVLTADKISDIYLNLVKKYFGDGVVIDEDITIYTEPDKFLEVKDALDKLGYDKYIMSEVTFVPDNYIALDEETTEKVVSLIEALEDIDDVQNVYHNLEM